MNKAIEFKLNKKKKKIPVTFDAMMESFLS